jgi:hypothetical protein
MAAMPGRTFLIHQKLSQRKLLLVQMCESAPARSDLRLRRRLPNAWKRVGIAFTFIVGFIVHEATRIGHRGGFHTFAFHSSFLAITPLTAEVFIDKSAMPYQARRCKFPT